jgi:WD40 repeat protein
VAEAPFAGALSAAPDGSQIAEAGKDMRVRIRNGITLAVESVLRVHDAPVVDVAWHPVLPLLATVSSDRRVRIWDLRSKLLVQEYGLFSPLPRNVCWSPDGTVLGVKVVGEVSKDRAQVHFFRPKVCQKDAK